MITGIWKDKISKLCLYYLKTDPDNWWELSRLSELILPEIQNDGFIGDTPEIKKFLKQIASLSDKLEVSSEDDDYISLSESEQDGTNNLNSKVKLLNIQIKTLQKSITNLKEDSEQSIKMIKVATDEAKKYKKLSETAKGRIIEVRVKKGAKIVRRMKESFHHTFPKLLSLIQERKHTMLYGPTGSGKTHICMSLAKAIDSRKFGFLSCSAGMSESKILGTTGIAKSGEFEYRISDFIDIFENGGLFLFDEMDRADSNVLMVINAALANGIIPVSSRTDQPYATKHSNFVCVCATNTVGSGGDRTYTAANRLDMSTLNRFWKIKIGYDLAVEKVLCPDEELQSYCWAIRHGIEVNRLEQVMSTRTMKEAYELKFGKSDFSWTQKEIDLSYFSGWPQDQFEKVKSSCYGKGVTLSLDWNELQAV